jgi:hypothetical protein
LAGVRKVTAQHLLADNQSRFYGDANPALTATISGFKNGEMLATGCVTGSANCTTRATPTSAVPGPYSITCTAGTLAAGNYDFTTFVPGQLTVNKAHLTVTADNQSRFPNVVFARASMALVSYRPPLSCHSPHGDPNVELVVSRLRGRAVQTGVR